MARWKDGRARRALFQKRRQGQLLGSSRQQLERGVSPGTGRQDAATPPAARQHAPAPTPPARTAWQGTRDASSSALFHTLLPSSVQLQKRRRHICDWLAQRWATTLWAVTQRKQQHELLPARGWLQRSPAAVLCVACDALLLSARTTDYCNCCVRRAAQRCSDCKRWHRADSQRPMAIVSNTQQHHRRTQAAAYEKVRRRRAKQRAASRIYKREAIVDSAGCAHHKHITSILARALGREWLRGASHSSSDGTVWLRLRWPAYDIRKGSRADMHSADRPCARPDSRALRLDRIS